MENFFWLAIQSDGLELLKKIHLKTGKSYPDLISEGIGLVYRKHFEVEETKKPLENSNRIKIGKSQNENKTTNR